MRRRLVPILPLCVLLGLAAGCSGPDLDEQDLERAREFVLSALPPMPPDASNRVADDPAAAALGEKLFFDTALSINDGVSCGTCHMPRRDFQDSAPRGFGIAETPRRTMPLRGVQWGAWFFWDGRKDSQWSQALEPLETPAEHGMTRDRVARVVIGKYRREYEALFGAAPDPSGWPVNASPLLPGEPMDNWNATSVEAQDAINRVFANTGKAMAAFQRTLLPQENRADRFFQARLDGRWPEPEDRLTRDEIAGFRLFTGKAGCDNCHSGPLYTDHFFHNTGVAIADPERPDYGRAFALLFLRLDPFTCDGLYSDADPAQCRELRFMSDDPAVFEGSFKTPGLRGVAARAPYMHAGQIDTLEAVVEHYVARPDPFAVLPEVDGTISPHGPHTDVPEISLSAMEKRQLVAFLKTL